MAPSMAVLWQGGGSGGVRIRRFDAVACDSAWLGETLAKAGDEAVFCLSSSVSAKFATGIEAL